MLGVDFISILSIFVLACFVGYYVVWSGTPALQAHRRPRCQVQWRTLRSLQPATIC